MNSTSPFIKLANALFLRAFVPMAHRLANFTNRKCAQKMAKLPPPMRHMPTVVAEKCVVFVAETVWNSGWRIDSGKMRTEVPMIGRDNNGVLGMNGREWMNSRGIGEIHSGNEEEATMFEQWAIGSANPANFSRPKAMKNFIKYDKI
jgi:hypothetical protein